MEIEEMLTALDYTAIRRAYRAGKSIRQIASEFQHSRNSVRRILRHTECKPAPTSRRRYPPVLGPFQSIIDQLLEDESDTLKRRQTAMNVYRRIRDTHAYSGGYAQVQRYMRIVRYHHQETLLPFPDRPNDFTDEQLRTAQHEGTNLEADGASSRRHARATNWSRPMANLLGTSIVEIIHTLHRLGWSQRRIAGELQVDRETVSRYLSHGELCSTPTHATASPPPAAVARPRLPTASSLEAGRLRAICRTDENWMLEILQGKKSLDSVQHPVLDTENRSSLDSNLRNGNLKCRNKSLTVLAKCHGIPSRSISQFLHIARATVKQYWRTFRVHGCEKLFVGFYDKQHKANDETVRDALFSILHTPPSAFEINRTTWKMSDLRRVLSEKGHRVSMQVMRKIIRDAGYHWRVARKVLTSNDPMYREKLENIQRILSTLGPNERFFSIDEYGPFAVKMQGGRSLTPPGQVRTVPQRQKSKGRLILTAALELSANQVTHFYSEKKNTAEMIKLLDVLLVQYADCDKIYFSWDAASWHASKTLYKRVDEVNSAEYRSQHRCPSVELVPLPSCAQFLNVIESVFSGMAKAIIHNSDYESLEACVAAIDRYYADRNAFFKANPKRAGKKIWGKESIASEFSPSNNCKNPKHSFIGF